MTLVEISEALRAVVVLRRVLPRMATEGWYGNQWAETADAVLADIEDYLTEQEKKAHAKN